MGSIDKQTDPNTTHTAKMAKHAEDEAARIQSARDLGQVPEQCGEDIGPAPGRGAVVTFTPLQILPKGEDDWTLAPAGHKGRSGLRCADAFDIAFEQMRRRDKFAKCPFTLGQIAIGRHYRDVVERYDAGGVKCASLEGTPSGGTGGDFMDSYAALGEEVRRLRSRIGSGLAMELRRVRPSKSGGAARRAITARALVDGFCLHDASLTAILRAHGWASTKEVRARARQALCGILDQMSAPAGQKNIRTWHKGD